jgi:hypothetical protein
MFKLIGLLYSRKDVFIREEYTFLREREKKRTAIPHVVRSYHWYNAGIAVLGLNNIYR